MDMSQMCTGAGDYFRTSKPHSEKLCNVCKSPQEDQVTEEEQVQDEDMVVVVG